MLSVECSMKYKRHNETLSCSVMLYVKKLTFSSIIQVSRMFDGKEFCVINGPPGLSKAAIETKIVEVSHCYIITTSWR